MFWFSLSPHSRPRLSTINTTNEQEMLKSIVWRLDSSVVPPTTLISLHVHMQQTQQLPSSTSCLNKPSCSRKQDRSLTFSLETTLKKQDPLFRKGINQLIYTVGYLIFFAYLNGPFRRYRSVQYDHTWSSVFLFPWALQPLKQLTLSHSKCQTMS